MAKRKKTKKFSVGRFLSRLTPGDFGRLGVWIGLVWATTVVVVLNWTSMSKVASPNNEVHQLTLNLKRAEKQNPLDIPLIQQIRSDLVIARLNAGETLKAREVLNQYKETLETTVGLDPTEAANFRNKLAFLYMSLKDFDAAIKQYTINLRNLAQQNTYKAKLLRARALNDRAVANHMRSQMFDSYEPANAKLVAGYSKSSQRDFQACKQLLGELARDRPGREQGREELSKVLELNQKFYSNHLAFENQENKLKGTTP